MQLVSAVVLGHTHRQHWLDELVHLVLVPAKAVRAEAPQQVQVGAPKRECGLAGIHLGVLVALHDSTAGMDPAGQ